MAALGETGFETGRQFAGVEGGARHRLERDIAIGAGNREDAVREGDVGLGGFEHVRGDLPALVDQLVGGMGQRGAADRQRARPAGAAAEPDRGGVALQHADLFERQAELFGGELGVGGLMPLARGLRAHQQGQRAGRVEARFGEFVGRKPGLLDIDRVPEPAIAAAAPRLFAPRGEAGGIGGGQRVVEVAGEIAAVIVQAERRRVRHRVGPDEIAPAQFVGVDPEAPGGVVDQPLDRIGRLGPAGAAIGIDRHRVRVDALDRDMDRRKGVDAAIHDRARGGRDLRREIRQVGAHIRGQLDRQAEEAKLLVERQIELGDVVAPLRVGDERLPSGRRPI